MEAESAALVAVVDELMAEATNGDYEVDEDGWPVYNNPVATAAAVPMDIYILWYNFNPSVPYASLSSRSTPRARAHAPSPTADRLVTASPNTVSLSGPEGPC